ncbi:MAG: basic secretory family protein [Prevotella sp.]|nr:basic secretory family protein [Prevotella sp.]
MKRILFLTFALLFLTCQGQDVKTDYPQLTDNDPTTYYIGKAGKNKMTFQVSYNSPVLSYKIYSSGEKPAHDPANWTLKGSNDGKKWTVVDERKNQKFCSRFQEILCIVQQPATYKQYIFELSTANKKENLIIAGILLSDKNLLAGWENFKYPEVNFESLDPETAGSKIYCETLVQNPDEYVKYHTQKVAEILYFSTEDPIVDVQHIDYTLKNYDGISAKGGNSPNINNVYSTRHIENSANESLHKLDFETRGVLYHELTHGYQYAPKGIGNYGNNKTFWACTEGIADAVRAEAGLFDMSTRRPGGNWMNGYRTTGFFIQWLTTKDPDAIRKFHRTVKDLEVWSFDGAIKEVFGPEAGIEGMWNEYQEFLKKK